MTYELRTTNRACPPFLWWIVVLACGLLVFTAGCEAGSTTAVRLQQVQQLTAEKQRLQVKLEKAEAQNQQLKKQVAVLSKLGGERRAERLNHIKEIRIGRYTNFYDEDKDGTAETLIVYVQPVDETGDVLKAAGAVEVQLWDLNKDDGKARLGQWTVGADELKKLWFATMITINYRFTFNVAGIVKDFTRPLTVKITFTEYLTGKTFTEQKVIKPNSL